MFYFFDVWVSEFAIIWVVSILGVVSLFISISIASSVGPGWLLHNLKLNEALCISIVLFDLPELWLRALTIVESLGLLVV